MADAQSDPIEVILSADVVIAALVQVSSAAVQFPEMPPKSSSASTDTLGTFVAGEPDFALILSTALVDQVVTALTDPLTLNWDFDKAEEAISVITTIAENGPGGYVTPDFQVVLPSGLSASDETALQTAASKDLGQPRVVVTLDARLHKMRTWTPGSPWWPAEETVNFLTPTRFRDLAHDARWRLRSV